MKQKDVVIGGAALVGAFAFLQEPETPPTIIDDVANVETMVAEVTGSPVKQDAKTIENQHGYDFFKIVMLETKRREAMGRKGKELRPYMDGKTKAIGYGCHMKYLPESWKKTIEQQGEKITEEQARQIMYEVFDNLKNEISRDLPHLNRAQLWAIQSLSYNWGYGNVKRSKLYQHLKSGDTSKATAKVWMSCHAGTENHRISRRLEVFLFTGKYKDAQHIADKAGRALQKRGDFKHYAK
jgi:GH24 family phage-related lysozyme (muramidase)